MIEIRTIREGEWPDAMTLWTTVFGDFPWIFDTLNVATQPRALEHTQVAVSEGKIVSAVDVFVREQRDADGIPRKVGAIGSVATYEEFRGRGLSGQLLKEVIALMERIGCDWSFLATGTHKHYARYGWFTTPLLHWKGSLRSAGSSSSNISELKTSEPLPFAQLGEIYNDFNKTRPLSHLRSLHYWREAIWTRLNQPEVRLFVYREGDSIAGYLAACFNEENLEVVEIGCRSGREEIIRPLLEHCAYESKAAGLVDWAFAMSIDDSFKPVVAELLANLESYDSSWTMSRPIADSFGEDKVKEMFAAKGACHYFLDRF